MDTKELRRIGTRRQKAEREAAELAEQLRRGRAARKAEPITD